MSVLEDIFTAGPVIPVLAFNNVTEAVTTSRTLYEAGMRVFEITLRHQTALEQVKAVIADLPSDAMVGVGTVLNADMAETAHATGAVFGVSPGLTAALAAKITALNWAFLPGTATLSEAMTALDYGFNSLKFFPASASGGAPYLKAAGAVLADARFCPTGGVTPLNAKDYLELAHVPVVGGSWMIIRRADGTVDQSETGTLAEAALKIKV